MSQPKKRYVIILEAKDSFQVAKYLLNISKQINDGLLDGVEPCYWEMNERK